MTIQDFSKRTGISKSALRYYESKNLLRATRSENGYRLYTADQIPVVKLISSLRLAGVKIKDIQAYLEEEDEQTKSEMLADWKKSIREQLDILKVGLRYLESYSQTEEIYLIEKEEENVIWFTAEADVGMFKSKFVEKGMQLKNLNIPIHNCYFVYLSGEGRIKGKLGFGVPFAIPEHQLPQGFSVEKMPPNIYIASPHRGPYTDIPTGYAKLLDYASEHQWIPTGPVLEWYRGDDFNTLDLLMPVMRLKNKGDQTDE